MKIPHCCLCVRDYSEFLNADIPLQIFHLTNMIDNIKKSNFLKFNFKFLFTLQYKICPVIYFNFLLRYCTEFLLVKCTDIELQYNHLFSPCLRHALSLLFYTAGDGANKC